MDSSAPTQFQQTKLILSHDDCHFETLISHLMSSSNDERSEAESLFNLCKQTNPYSLSLKLVDLLKGSTDHKGARAMSAILLQKLFDHSDTYIWPRIPQSALRYILLSCVMHEEDKSMANKLCYTHPEYDNEWHDLLPNVGQFMSTSDSPMLQESGFLILSEVFQYLGETDLDSCIKGTHACIRYYLANSSNPDVRVAALRAVINSIKCDVSSDAMDRVEELLPIMMKNLKESLKLGQEASAQEALMLLIEFADDEPRFFTRHQLVDVVGSMLEIAKAKSLQKGTRNLAVEFLITLEARDRQGPLE